MKRNFHFALALFGAAALIIYGSATPAQKRGTKRATTVVTTAAKLPSVREIDAAGLQKLLARNATEARPLLINFWATWCEPCREEFPDLVKIDAEYRARGLDFVIVSLDDIGDIKTTVPQYLQRMRARMPAFLLNTPEPAMAIQAVDPEWAGGLPATFLFDAHGQIVFKHMGRIKPADVRAAIEQHVINKR